MTADGYPIAYCAPGRKFDAALTLMFKGEQVARILEHPWLEGKTDVIVISEPPDFSAEFSCALRSGKTISDKEKTGE